MVGEWRSSAVPVAFHRRSGAVPVPSSASVAAGRNPAVLAVCVAGLARPAGWPSREWETGSENSPNTDTVYMNKQKQELRTGKLDRQNGQKFCLL